MMPGTSMQGGIMLLKWLVYYQQYINKMKLLYMLVQYGYKTLIALII